MESQLADWTVATVGGLMMLSGIGGLRGSSKIKYREARSQRERAYWSWAYMLGGPGMIVLGVPRAMGAPLSVRLITGPVSLGLVITALVLLIRARWLRSRSGRAVAGPSEANRR